MLFTGWLLRTFIDDKGAPISQEMCHYDNALGLTMNDLSAVTPYLAAAPEQVRAAMNRVLSPRQSEILQDLRSRPKCDGSFTREDCRVLIQRF